MLTLYHYPHCPYCVRVRMTAGYKNINLEMKELPYDDEKTPIKMTGTKALPILEMPTGEFMNESLNIIDYLQDQYPDPTIYPNEVNRVLAVETFERIKMGFGNTINKICMPYWVTLPEFDENAKTYFQTKKEQILGYSFDELRDKATDLMIEMTELLKPLEDELGSKDFFFDKFSLVDILICSHLKGLDDFPDYSFPSAIGLYMQRVRNITKL